MPFDDELDTPAGDAAIDDDDENLSPVVSDTDLDDDSVDADDEGRSAKGKGKGDDEDLRKKLEDLDKRFQGSTRSWQEAERRRQEAEARAAANEERLKKWEKYGVKADEIDRLIAQQEGQNPQAGQPAATLPENLLTREELAQALAWQEIKTKWENHKETFLEKEDNQLFNSKGWRKWMDDEAQALAQEEIDRYGQVQSGPKEVWAKVQKRLQGMRAEMEKKANKSVDETREKVNKQGIVQSRQNQRRKVESTDDDDTPWTRQAYVDTFRNHQRRFKEGG